MIRHDDLETLSSLRVFICISPLVWFVFSPILLLEASADLIVAAEAHTAFTVLAVISTRVHAFTLTRGGALSLVVGDTTRGRGSGRRRSGRRRSGRRRRWSWASNTSTDFIVAAEAHSAFAILAVVSTRVHALTLTRCGALSLEVVCATRGRGSGCRRSGRRRRWSWT